MEEVDKKFYERIHSGGFAESLLLRARDDIHQVFLSLARPHETSTILDFGVSDEINAGANGLERNHLHPQNITAVGLGTGTEFAKVFPEVNYIQTEPFQELPFEADRFDIAFSKAVLEHMGSRANQRWMVNELGRVAKFVFLAVPNRLFPVEHHTGLPFVHYVDASFAFFCKLFGRQKWAREEELILMRLESLKELVPPGFEFEAGTCGIPLGPFSSNLYLAIKSDDNA